MWAEDRWFGEDKLTHATYCYALTLTLRGSGVPVVATAIIVTAAGIAVEIVQGVRKLMGKTVYADDPSYRDLVWDGIGLLMGLGAAWLLNL